MNFNVLKKFKKNKILKLQKLADPKELIGMIFVDIVNDTVPELKKVS